MKKLVLSAAALLIAAVGFSQNISEVDQNGILNNGEITQNGVANYSNLVQIDEGNLTILNQTGNNSSNANQNGLNNQYYFTQESFVGDVTNTSTLDQDGSNNFVGYSQFGDGNSSAVVQNNLDIGPGPAFDGPIGLGNNVGGSQTGNGHFSTITQIGDANGALVFQNNQLGYNEIAQTGIGNVSEVSTTTFGDLAPLPIGDPYLAGSIITQNGFSNYTSVNQSGDNLLSTVTQTADNPGPIYSNEAYITQSGYLSSSTVTQGMDVFGFADNTATVNQSGFGTTANNSTITQTGANTATVNQNNDPFGGI